MSHPTKFQPSSNQFLSDHSVPETFLRHLRFLIKFVNILIDFFPNLPASLLKIINDCCLSCLLINFYHAAEITCQIDFKFSRRHEMKQARQRRLLHNSQNVWELQAISPFSHHSWILILIFDAFELSRFPWQIMPLALLNNCALLVISRLAVSSEQLTMQLHFLRQTLFSQLFNKRQLFRSN